MADGAGRILQAALRRHLVAALRDIRDQLDAAGTLSALGPAGPEWAGSGLEDRLLAPLQGVTASGPFTDAVLRGLHGLTGAAGGAPVLATLHGWAPAPGAHRGIAYAVRVDAASGAFAFAVHLAGDGGGARLGLSARGGGSAPVAGPVGAGWTLTASGTAGGGLELELGDDGSVAVAAGTAGDALLVELARGDRGERIGPAPGPGVRLGALAFGGELRVDGSGLARRGWVRCSGGAVELVSDVLSGLIRGVAPLPLSVELGLTPERGMTLGGSSSLQVHLPVTRSLAGVDLDGLDISVDGDLERAALRVALRTSARVSLPGAPVRMRFDGLGLELPFAVGNDVPHPGFDPAGLLPVIPTGAAISIDLPVISAAGTMSRGPDGSFAGGLGASVPPVQAAAFGILRLGPPSFLVMLGATFTPAIQVGFGFGIRGVGGVLAVGRRVDREGLLQSVADGSAAGLLFPTDPAASARGAEVALRRIFPEARGSVVAGPMFQLSWGEGIVQASVAVLVEVSAQPRLTILGKLVVGIPHPAAPLIFLQATFAGQFDPAEPSVLLVASLTGSHIVGLPLAGDLCLLARGGADADVIFSAGGFHPAFPLPRGVPPLRRISTDLSTLPWLELRCEAYVALTTNTLQFGARVDLSAAVAGCGLRGHLGFDALVQISPLHFRIDVSIGIALTVFGEELVGVSLDLTLEGPAKWHARGRGSVHLFLFSVPFDFEAEWGSTPPLPPAGTPDIEGDLVAALSKPDAWTVRRPANAPSGVTLTPEADAALAGGDRVDPYGGFGVRQEVVPLRLTIDRFGNLPLGDRQTWDITGDTTPEVGEHRSRFATGQYQTLSDDRALTQRAFDEYRAGIDLASAGLTFPPEQPFTIGFETSTFVAAVPKPTGAVVDVTFPSELLAAAAAASDIAHPFWSPPPPDAAVAVSPAVPLALASVWSLAPVDAPDIGPTAAELRQAAADDPSGTLMVVEAWEVVV
jgi:hypothetical protein